MYVDEDKVIQRITFGDSFVAEKPLRESVVRQVIDQLWFLLFGGTR